MTTFTSGFSFFILSKTSRPLLLGDRRRAAQHRLISCYADNVERCFPIVKTRYPCRTKVFSKRSSMFFSSSIEPKLKSEIDRERVKYFLSKPYRPDEVVRILQSLIERES